MLTIRPWNTFLGSVKIKIHIVLCVTCTMWKADITVQNICLCAVSVMCFLHGYMLVIFSRISKMSYMIRPVKGCINVSSHVKTIIKVDDNCYICVYSHSMYYPLCFIFDHSMILEMFKLVDVMQGIYNVLASWWPFVI